MAKKPTDSSILYILGNFTEKVWKYAEHEPKHVDQNARIKQGPDWKVQDHEGKQLIIFLY